MLIPRPETELLVEAILRYAAELWPDRMVNAGAETRVAADSSVHAGGAAGAEAAAPGTEAGGKEASPGSGAGDARAARPLTAVDIGAAAERSPSRWRRKRRMWVVCAA